MKHFNHTIDCARGINQKCKEQINVYRALKEVLSKKEYCLLSCGCAESVNGIECDFVLDLSECLVDKKNHQPIRFTANVKICIMI